MLNTSCLVCDRQGASHNVFYDVITGGTGSSQHLAQHLRHRLQGVLAVTLTLQEDTPHRLCQGCEGTLCDIENRVQHFRDTHSATTEKYAQRKRATNIPSFTDLTVDKVRHSERGSETQCETTACESETRKSRNFQPSEGAWTDCHQTRQGKDVVWTQHVPLPVSKPGTGAVSGPQVSKSTSAGMTVGTDTAAATCSKAMTSGRPTEDDGSETEGYAAEDEDVETPTRATLQGQQGLLGRREDHPEGSVVQGQAANMPSQQTTSTDYTKATSSQQDASAGGGQTALDVSSTSVNYIQQKVVRDRQSTTNLGGGEQILHRGGDRQGDVAPVSGIQRQTLQQTAGEEGLNLSMFHDRNRTTETSRVTSEGCASLQEAGEVQNREGQVNRLAKQPYVERSSGADLQPSRYSPVVKTCSCSVYKGNTSCATEREMSMPSHDDHTMNLKVASERNDDEALDLSRTPKDQFVEGQYQAEVADSVLDLTLRRESPAENSTTAGQRPNEETEQPDRTCRSEERAIIRLPRDAVVINSSTQKPGESEGRNTNMSQSQRKEGSYPEENTNVTPEIQARKVQEVIWNRSKPLQDSQGFLGGKLRAPPPLIHMSEVKQETVENGSLTEPSGLSYLDKMPILIAPIEEADGPSYVQQTLNKSQAMYTEGFDEPLRKRRKVHRSSFDMSPQQGASSRFPVLNTHVSATLNVANPAREQAAFDGKVHTNQNTEQNPEKAPAQEPMQTTTMIQGTVRIPLNQLRNIRKAPADISLITEATVHSGPVQNQNSIVSKLTPVCRTKIPLSIGLNPETCTLKIPISQQLHSQAMLVSQAVGNGTYSHCFPCSDPGHPDKGNFFNSAHPRKTMDAMNPAPKGQLVVTNQQVATNAQMANHALHSGHGQPPKGQGHDGMGQPTEGPTHPTGQGQPPNQQGQRYQPANQMVSRAWPNLQMGGSERVVYAQDHSAVPAPVPHATAMIPSNGNLPQGPSNPRPAAHENMDWQQDKENELQSEDDIEEEEPAPDAERPVTVVGNKTDSSGRRQLLRPWLEERLNKGNIPGFQWYDKKKNLFQIPWKHRSKNDWRPDNCTIFMEWAIHTGKYRVGIDKPDYCRWKTRLRCAFNQAADIRERKDLKKMKCGEPYKVYEFLPKSEVRPKSQAKPKVDTTQTSRSEVIGQGSAVFPVSQSGLTECLGNPVLQKTPPYTPTSCTLAGASIPINQPVKYFESPPRTQSLNSTQPLNRPQTNRLETIVQTTETDQQNPPASIPVETNNNKFSWDPELEERPLVIDLDRNEEEGQSKMTKDEKREQEDSYAERQARTNNFVHLRGMLRKHQGTQSGERPYLCDLCGQCFTSVDSLNNHRETHCERSVHPAEATENDPGSDFVVASNSKRSDSDEGATTLARDPTSQSTSSAPVTRGPTSASNKDNSPDKPVSEAQVTLSSEGEKANIPAETSSSDLVRDANDLPQVNSDSKGQPKSGPKNGSWQIEPVKDKRLMLRIQKH